MRLYIVALAAAVLAGCGGSEEEKKKVTTPLNTEPVKIVTLTEPYRYQPPKVAGIPSTIPVISEAEAERRVTLSPATSEDPVLTLEDARGAKLATFQLEPIRGKGFPELKLLLKARRLGDTAPASPVQPQCVDAGRCEYRLSRKYEVALSDSNALQLVPRGDGIAVVARSLSVDEPKAVEVLFSVDSQVLSKRRIVLLSQ
jgi:hypothetical protein